MARPDAERRQRQLARSKNQGGLTQIINWIKENPAQAAGMLAQSVGLDARPPWMREKQDVKDLGAEAGLLAAGAVPIVGPLGRVGAKAGQAAKKASDAAKVAEKAAGAAKPRPISGARAGGSGTGQAAGGANRLSARELAAKRRGTKRGRTEEGAKKVEAMEAKEASRTSINTGKASPVQIRQGSEGPKLPKGVSEKDLTKFQSKRAKDLATKGNKRGRTKAEKERAAKDIQERLEIGARLRAEGRRPGFDTPYRGGADDLPVGNPAVTVRTTPRPSGTSTRPSGTTAPAAKPGSAVVSTGRGSTTREATGRRPKRPSSEVAARPKGEVVQGRVVRETREPIDINARPIRRPIGEIGSGRSGAGTGGGQIPRAAIGSGSKPAAAAGKSKMGKGKKAAIAGAGLVGAGLLAKQFDSDKSPTSAGGASDKPKPKPKAASTLRDKYGRQISREEYNKRESYRKSLASMSDKDRAKARKAEMKRREEYRKTEGASRFGGRANLITRNLDIREGVSSRMVNKEMKAAAGRGGSRQAAIDARSPYLRKKK